MQNRANFQGLLVSLQIRSGVFRYDFYIPMVSLKHYAEFIEENILPDKSHSAEIFRIENWKPQIVLSNRQVCLYLVAAEGFVICSP